MLPWMAAAETPARFRSRLTLSAPCLVRVKTRAEEMFFCSKIQTISLVLFSRSTGQADCWMTSTGEDTGSTGHPCRVV